MIDRTMQRRVWRRSRSRVAVLLVAWLAGASVATGQSLDQRLDRAIDAARIGSTRIGVSVIDTGTGAGLAGRDESGSYIPASNMKLITSAVALSLLGPRYEFRTELRADGDRLILVGGGDPALGDPDLLSQAVPAQTVTDLIDQLAEAARRGVPGRVSEIVADDRVFDRELVHPSWPADQLNRWYCAEVSGLSFHANVLDVFPAPAREGVGTAPTIALQPAGAWMEMANKARTVAQGQTSVWLSRDPDANRFTLYGQVRSALAEPARVTLHDPGLVLAGLLAERLESLGVVVGERPGGGTEGARLATADDPATGDALAVITTSMRDAARRCNTDSHNLYAESMLKLIGRTVTGEPGSWRNGAAVVRMRLSEFAGPESAAASVISDGSGMSRDNRVTPRLITRWLGAATERGAWGDDFIASLATPGAGPLRNRFQSRAPANDLRAKTGYLNGVRALSGYLTHPGTGRRLAFSILANDIPPENDQAVRQLIDDLVLEIDRWLTGDGAPGAGRDPAHGG